MTENIEEGKKIYKNNANSFKVKFQESSDFLPEFFEIEEDGYSLQFEYDLKSLKNIKSEVKNLHQEQAVTINREISQIEKTQTGQITYNFVDNQTDIVYEIKNNKLKEDIIIEKEQEQYTYTFAINSANLQFIQKEDGTST